ncbi:hypothetical protein [Bacillus sp. J33]|nr:hypothetical protein [Bacillus sp. J33]
MLPLLKAGCVKAYWGLGAFSGNQQANVTKPKVFNGIMVLLT